MANMSTQTESDPDRNKQQGDKTQGLVARTTENAAALATDGVRKTRARFDEQVSKQREQITGKVRTLGRALRGAGEMLEEDNIVSHGLHYASDKVNSVAGYIADVNPTEVVDQLRGVARRRPLWFYGGAFTTGLLLARFARSSAAGASTPATKVSERSTAASSSPSHAPGAKAGTSAAVDASDGARRKTNVGDESGARPSTTPRSGALRT